MIRCERCNAAIAQGWVVYVDGKPYHKNCAEIRNTMDERTTEDAYDAGWRDAVRLYAVWHDGSQLVGVMEKPLNQVLDEGPPADQKNLALHALSFDKEDLV